MKVVAIRLRTPQESEFQPLISTLPHIQQNVVGS